MGVDENRPEIAGTLVAASIPPGTDSGASEVPGTVGPSVAPETTVPIASGAGTRPTTAAGATANDGLTGVPPEVFHQFPHAGGMVYRGSEAVVYPSTHPDYGDVAVKVYLRPMDPSAEVIGLLKGGVHEHLVQLYEATEIDGVWVEVLERVTGGTLSDIATGASLGELTAVVEELASALWHFHTDLGLVHRDLKPANILVRALDPLDLVLADFGLAAFSNEASGVLETQDRTVHYSAPETNAGVPPRPAIDWWSVGIIIAELLLGRHPFAGSSNVEVALHLVARDVDLSGIEDRRWRSLCRGLLTREGPHRWGYEEVREWLDGGDPEVWAPERTRDPYCFAGGEYTTNSELAAAMSEHERWSQAAGTVKERIQWEQLIAWLVNGASGDQQLAQALDEASKLKDPDERLFCMLRRGFPQLVAVYRGYPVSGDGIERLARDAAAGADDGDALETVNSLFRTRALRWDGESHKDLDDRWQDGWSEIQSHLSRHNIDTSGTAAQVARARLLLSLVDEHSAEQFRSNSRRLGGGDGGTVEWFSDLADAGGRSSIAAIATEALQATAAAEERRDRADEEQRRLEQRRARWEETSRRYGRTRSMLGYCLIPLTLMAVGTIALRVVTGPAPGDGSLLDEFLASAPVTDLFAEVPWTQGYVTFLTSPLVAVSLFLVAVVLYLRARNVGTEDGPVRTEWERRSMQAVIAATIIYLPVLAPVAAVVEIENGRSLPEARNTNVGIRRVLWVTTLVYLAFGGVVVWVRTQSYPEMVATYPDWYQEFLAEVPPQLLLGIDSGPAAWTVWLSFGAALVAFVLGIRSYRNRGQVENASRIVISVIALIVLPVAVLFGLFYPLLAVGIVIATAVGIMLAIWLLIAMFDS